MRKDVRQQASASSTISAFKGACYTIYLFLAMTATALMAAAIASARSHHRNGTTLLVVMFVFIFIAFLLILALIHTFWPDGVIYQCCAMKKLIRDEEMARMVRPVSVSDAKFQKLVPRPLAVKTKASKTTDLRRWRMVDEQTNDYA